MTKTELAASLGVARSTLYRQSKQQEKDLKLKKEIECVMGKNVGYGYRRIAAHLGRNHKPVQRVMQIYGMRAYRRRGRRPKKQGRTKVSYPNLLKSIYPTHPNHIWAGDFTYIPYQGKFLYLATVIDLFTREIIGAVIMDRHDASLVLQALWDALRHRPHPEIFHSDNGREYGAKVFTITLSELDIQISRSKLGAPWENGYQESFYDKYKVELGDPQRFKSKGELVYAIHKQIYYYNTERIHSALRMPPKLFAFRHENMLEKVSHVWGS